MERETAALPNPSYGNALVNRLFGAAAVADTSCEPRYTVYIPDTYLRDDTTVPHFLKPLTGDLQMNMLEMSPSDFLSVELKSALKPLISQRSAEGLENFSWALPATESTDSHVATFVKNNDYLINLYARNQFESNLKAASDLLDKCIAQQAEVHALETLSIAAAADLLLSGQTHAPNAKLAELNILAASKQAGVDADEYLASLQIVLKSQQNARSVRLAAHAMLGGSLNYGERILFLRDIYAKNIAQIRGRIRSAREGMRNANLIGSSFPPPPEWDASRSDNLKILIDYLTKIIQALQISTQLETKRSFIVDLVGDSENGRFGISREQLRDAFYFQRPLEFDMSLLWPDARQIPRLSRVGLTLVTPSTMPAFKKASESDDAAMAKYEFFTAFRQRALRNLTFSCSLELMDGHAEFEEKETFFAQRSFDFGGRLGFSDGAMPSDFAFVDEMDVRNRRAGCVWKLIFGGGFHDNGTSEGVGSLAYVMYSGLADLGEIHDVRLFVETLGA